MIPNPAQTEEQEEPMQPSSQTHPDAHSPDLAACVSWSFPLLPFLLP